jgi:hypothetical protein
VILVAIKESLLIDFLFLESDMHRWDRIVMLKKTQKFQMILIKSKIRA